MCMTGKHFAVVVAGLLCFVGAVCAAEDEIASKPIKASLLIGIKVEHPNGEALGYIEDVVLDAKRERISYAVLSHGGYLGVADKRFFVPWSRSSSANRARRCGCRSRSRC